MRAKARAARPADRIDPLEQPTLVLGAPGGEQLEPAAAEEQLLITGTLAGTGWKIGRFNVLRMIGRGGMGMVFAAYDEELGRKVAIKLLQGSPAAGSVARSRMLREAQALARLSHPNVVTVYEVGEFEQQVYIAMEYVLGETLYRWLKKPRRWREVVEVFIEAGRGLAVAHAAKILHRDFKPANVLIGADGRVRVLDFGLAVAEGLVTSGVAERQSASGRYQTALTEVGSVVGTPAYMAPERLFMDPAVDARSDQFSFCVALYEGLYGSRPFPGLTYDELRPRILAGEIPEPPRGSRVPGWLRRVVLRGLATAPGDRYPDMHALITALQRDPGRLRQRVLVGLGVGAVLMAGGFGLAQATSSPSQCPDARGRLGWAAQRPEVERAVLATQTKFAADTWTHIAERLDAYEARWAGAHRAACEARAHGEQSDAQVDLRMACLERRQAEFTALVMRLAEADAETARAAAVAVDDLPSPDRCTNTAALKAAVPLPDDPEAAAKVVGLFDRLAQARAAMTTRKLEASEALVAEVMLGAEALKYAPLKAATLVVRGDLEDRNGKYEASLASYTEALWLADESRDDDLLAEAMAGVINALGVRMVRFDAALAWRRHAHSVIARLGEGSPGHTRLLRAFGAVLSLQGRDTDAVAVLREALRLDSARVEPDDRAIIADLKGLGTAESMLGNLEESRALLEQALARLEKIDGPNHPDVAAILNNLAGTLFEQDEADRALALYERTLAILEQSLGPDHLELTPALANLGSMLAERGQLDRGQALLERSLAIEERTLGSAHPEMVLTLSFLADVAVARGDLATARSQLERALAIRERHFPADSHLVAISRTELAVIDLERGKIPAATKELERALAALEKLPHAKYEVPYTRFMLARALRAAGKREPARSLASTALAEYRALGEARDAEVVRKSIAEITEWLANEARKGR